MVFWAIFIPAVALILMLYFANINTILNGKRIANKIDESNPLKASKRELGNTFVSLLIFASAGLFVGYAIEKGWGQVYEQIEFKVFDVVYLIASFFLALGIHDVYFYFTHRFLHSKLMFKRVHLWHHKSHSANAWSSFSFHPIEGVIQIGVVPLVMFILPVHESVLMLFTFFLSLISVYGHCGFELRPNKVGVFSMFNTSLHHYQHHQFVRYNFGIYLNYWDRLFKTNYPKYEESFNELKEKIKLKNSK